MPYTITAETSENIKIGQLLYMDHRTCKLGVCIPNKRMIPVAIAMDSYDKGDMMEIDVATGKNGRIHAIHTEGK